MPVIITVKGVGLTIDILLWRVYGRAGNTSDMLRRAHRLNPGLAQRGTVLPLLATVTLPDLPTAKPQPVRRTVNLFGEV